LNMTDFDIFPQIPFSQTGKYLIFVSKTAKKRRNNLFLRMKKQVCNM